MRNRNLTADALFDGQAFSKAHVLLVQENGVIEGIVPENAVHGEIEKFDGILMPGLINCHCHLELSHLKDAVPPGTGLIPFLISVVTQRGQFESIKEEKIRLAERELFQNAIVAVADICNTADAVAVKKSSSILWYNLVEVLNLQDANLQTALQNYGAVLQQHLDAGLKAVLTPHAPYTVSDATLKELNTRTAGKVISVHNSETPAENELFKNGTGAFLQLYQLFGYQHSPFAVSGKSSLQSWLPHFTKGQTILLVHNTFMSKEDVLFAKAHAEKFNLKLIYCLCPNANLYIENTLPPVDLFIKHNCHMVIGTDSYSSNRQLNIMSELKTLKEAYPHLELETLLRWATGNASAIWGFEEVGAFKKGMKPGVVLFNAHDFSVKRIL
jgi:cytosine/adenosine deaminase-related metal-dependent hydrolase